MGLPDASVTQRLWWTFRNWGDGAREGEYWIAYSEYAKPQQNRQVNNAHFLLVWGTFPTMTVLLCGLQGSTLSRDQDFGISLSWISLFILVLWPWVHGAGVGSCLCRSEYLKLNNQRILGHVVIWYWGQFCGIFFSSATFLYVFHAVWNSRLQSVLERSTLNGNFCKASTSVTMGRLECCRTSV